MNSANGAHFATIESPSAATEELTASYPDDRAWLVRFFRRRGVPPEEAEDLAQETVLRALIHLRRHGRQRADLGPLMRTIARNLLIERVRRSTPVTVSWTDGFDLVDTSPEPEEATVAAERKAALRQAMRSLAPRHRRVVDLWIGGRTPTEIARELGIKRNAADAILHRARRSLAAKLEGRLAGVVLPAILLRLRARARRVGEMAGLIDPAGAIAPAAGALAVVGAVVALSLPAPQPRTGEADETVVPAPAVQRVAGAQETSTPPEPGPVATESESEQPSPPDGSATVVVDLRNHEGALGGEWTDQDGETHFLGLEWEVERDHAGRRGVTESLLDSVGEAACEGVSRLCDRLSGQ